MREILFRGKSKDNGEWVYGYFSPCCFGRFPFPPAIIPKDKMDSGSWEPKEIIPETVSEFTGLNDKNGTRIFEGDIVRRTCVNLNFDYIVKFNNDLAEFELELIKDGGSLAMFHGTAGEVIGNIHDNPELLKGERE